MKRFFGALITWPLLGLFATAIGGSAAIALGVSSGRTALGVAFMIHAFWLFISSAMTFRRKSKLSGDDVSTLVRITNFVSLVTTSFIVIPTYLMVSFGPPASVSFNTLEIPGTLIVALVGVGFLQDLIFSGVADRRNGGAKKSQKTKTRRSAAGSDDVDALLAKYGE